MNTKQNGTNRKPSSDALKMSKYFIKKCFFPSVDFLFSYFHNLICEKLTFYEIKDIDRL